VEKTLRRHDNPPRNITNNKNKKRKQTTKRKEKEREGRIE
jgi:hypothetical protein